MLLMASYMQRHNYHRLAGRIGDVKTDGRRKLLCLPSTIRTAWTPAVCILNVILYCHVMCLSASSSSAGFQQGKAPATAIEGISEEDASQTDGCQAISYLGLSDRQRVHDWQFSASSERGMEEYIRRLTSSSPADDNATEADSSSLASLLGHDYYSAFMSLLVWTSASSSNNHQQVADDERVLVFEASAGKVGPPKGGPAQYARLHLDQEKAWCPAMASEEEWLQIDFGAPAQIGAILTQGRESMDGKRGEWITSYFLSHSQDARIWQYVDDLYGEPKIFIGNQDSSTVQKNYVNTDSGLTARFVRVHPLSWSSYPCLRLEFIGCQRCRAVITSEPWARTDVSSCWSPSSSCSDLESGRPSGGESRVAADGFVSWRAGTEDQNQWLRLGFQHPKWIYGIAMMGLARAPFPEDAQTPWIGELISYKDIFLVSFAVAFSNDTKSWLWYSDFASDGVELKESSKIFEGNWDAMIERHHYFLRPIMARYLKIHPITWHEGIGAKIRLFGCAREQSKEELPSNGFKISPGKKEIVMMDSSCKQGFMRVNQYSQCEKNLAFNSHTIFLGGRPVKDDAFKWSSLDRMYPKRHQKKLRALPSSNGISRNKQDRVKMHKHRHRHGHGSALSLRSQDGRSVRHRKAAINSSSIQKGVTEDYYYQDNTVHTAASSSLEGCIILDNQNSESPEFVLDLGEEGTVISNVVISMWQGGPHLTPQEAEIYRDYLYGLQELSVLVSNSSSIRLGSSRQHISTVTYFHPNNNGQHYCGSISRAEGALFRQKIHFTCSSSSVAPARGRFLIMRATGSPVRWSRAFKAVVCGVYVL